MSRRALWEGVPENEGVRGSVPRGASEALRGPRAPIVSNESQECQKGVLTLENGLTSLNKEVRPFFLSDNSISNLPSVSSLSDCRIWRS